MSDKPSQMQSVKQTFVIVPLINLGSLEIYSLLTVSRPKVYVKIQEDA